MENLFTLLQINDSMFPIGGFTHSYGLEAYVDQGIVKDNETAAEYAEKMLRHNIYYNDAAFLYQAWNLSLGSWKKIEELDELVTALKIPAEISAASKKLGLRFLKLTQELQEIKECSRYLKAIEKGKLFGHYSIAFALYAKNAKINLSDTLTAFYYNSLNAIVTNFAKIIPISQMIAQKILFDLKPVVAELVRSQGEVSAEKLGICCLGQDIKCAQHEKQYTRIYIS